jgi:hypothetical protein
MSIDVTSLRGALHPVAPAADRVAAPAAPAKPAAAFADVLEIETARANREARRAGEIPATVWEEVEAANRLFDELQADGRRIVFDDGRLNGRLVISLCDLDGRVLRSVAPGELVGTPPLSADTARLNGGAA